MSGGEVTCPECLKSFDTSQGFAVHWGWTHDGPTPDDIDTSRSEETKRKIAEAIEGTTRPEEVCRSMSETLKGRTFSEETRRRISESKMGEKNPMYGREITADHRRKLSESHKGERSSFWNGGSPDPYPEEWDNILREFIREIYNRTCQLCGDHEEQVGHRLDVHHLDGDKENLEWDNLAPLCRGCHMRMEGWLRRGIYGG